MDSIQVPLVINKLQSKDIYDYLAAQGMIGLNELYLIENDGTEGVVSVAYDSENKKLTYTDTAGATHNIVTVLALKNAMSLSNVASDGSYESLNYKPSINSVTLSGNKTTSDLNISYDDLTNQPTIPQTTTAYSSSDASKAMTGVATASALVNYVPKTRIVSGSGALQGGGELDEDLTITHKTAPTGLVAGAYKVATDAYGHVMLGSTILPSEINAESTTYNVVESCTHLDGSYGTIFILGTETETFHLDTMPTLGTTLKIYHMNLSETTDLTVHFDIDLMHEDNDVIYSNGTLRTTSWDVLIAANTYNFVTFKRFFFNNKYYLFIDRNNYEQA